MMQIFVQAVLPFSHALSVMVAVLMKGQSSTWSQKSNMTDANGSPENITTTLNCTTDLWGTDTIYLNATVSIPSFPIDVTRNLDQLAVNAVGLGLNSSILNHLKSAGAVASSTWPVFLGPVGADITAQMDGSVAFGGYGRAKIVGSGLTAPLQTDTSWRTELVVTVTDIEMGFPNDTLKGIQCSSQRICIDRAFALVTFPPDTLQNFMGNAGGNFVGSSFGIYVDHLWK